MKNSYEMGSPEWQIFENAYSARLNSITQNELAQRHLKAAGEQRERWLQYEAALKKLDPDFPGFEQ